MAVPAVGRESSADRSSSLASSRRVPVTGVVSVMSRGTTSGVSSGTAPTDSTGMSEGSLRMPSASPSS